jgi:hypothetical protein
VTWTAYGRNLRASLEDLLERARWGRCRGHAVEAGVCAEGGRAGRSLGIAALEDKIVQRAVVEVRGAVYEARRFLADLRERFARFGLGPHPDKTRLIEFGRYAARDRRRRGLGKPETMRLPGVHAHLREVPERKVLD